MTETRPRERVESIGGAVHERLAVQVERRVQNGADPGATLELPNDSVVLGIPRLVHEMSARGAVLRMDGRHNLVTALRRGGEGQHHVRRGEALRVDQIVACALAEDAR